MKWPVLEQSLSVPSEVPGGGQLMSFSQLEMKTASLSSADLKFGLCFLISADCLANGKKKGTGGTSGSLNWFKYVEAFTG